MGRAALPPKPSWRPTRAERQIIMDALTPLSKAFNALFPDEVLDHPAVRPLIKADEPLVHVWADGSVSVVAEAMRPLLASLKEKAGPAPQPEPMLRHPQA